MDFDSAIVAHSRWKRRLTTALAEGDETLDPAAIRRDDQCDLGKWLKGEGSVHAKRPEYAQLARSHTDFHVAAGQIAEHICRGDREGAERLLGTDGQFVRTSSSVVMLIASMRDGLSAAPPAR